MKNQYGKSNFLPLKTTLGGSVVGGECLPKTAVLCACLYAEKTELLIFKKTNENLVEENIASVLAVPRNVEKTIRTGLS